MYLLEVKKLAVWHPFGPILVPVEDIEQDKSITKNSLNLYLLGVKMNFIHGHIT